MAELGGMVASAILKMVDQQIGSAIGGQITLQEDFSKDLKKMKMALESVEAVLKVAERRSITEEPTRLWLKRLKDAMYDISEMIDEFEADTQAITKPSARKFTFKKYLADIILCLPISPKIILANRMKTMREDLEVITRQHDNFNLLQGTNANELRETDIRETSSNMNVQIIGRIEERDTILASLSDSMAEDMTVLPIYGIGGLGKTTVTKMIFNSSQFKDYTQVWVYVSQTFDLKKIGNSIISQLSEEGKETQYTMLEMINKSLQNLLAGKKILVVLDDLWEDRKSHLDDLMAMLSVGEGSKVIVIVTTRDEDIAKKISTIKPHKLATLTDGMCWSIIKQKSDFKSRGDKKQLKQIGKDIASKCGGVALAAHSLGHMLRSMIIDHWKSVRDSDIWYMSPSEDKDSVLASLRLSYSVMPSDLKLCFAYCAIFPKGHKIMKNDLIHQWVSLGFIRPTNIFSSWQLGEKFIVQLMGLSFLQDSKSPLIAGVHLEDDASFIMHDLVHDLAIYVLDDEILVARKHKSTWRSCCRYALLNDCSKPPDSSKIRALRFQNCGEIGIQGTAFSSAKSLRVLDLSECSLHKFPDSIGGLKQLRYLNAPRVQDEVIPNSIIKLTKLLYLNLSESSTIKAIPELIGEIEDLVYLDLSGCSRIQGLPKSLGKLKKLVHLDLSNCSHVNGISVLLKDLTKLQYLNLSYCKNIGELPRALGGLSNLQYLNLAFSSYLECCQEAEVLGALTKLEYLNLCSDCCDLKKLPEALPGSVKLRYLNLSGCRSIQELPRLFPDLKNLVHLDLSNCLEVTGVPEALIGLTKLQYLNLSIPGRNYKYGDQCLKGLSEVISNFTELRYLNLSGCVVFISGGILDMSKEENPIDIFLYSISTLTNLEHLDLSYNRDIRSIPRSFCKLQKLHTLDLSRCNVESGIPESVCSIDSLRFLYGPVMSNQSQLSSSLVALPHFAVHAGDGASSSNLVMLQHTDPFDLQITRLENVKSVEEAQIIKLFKKQRLVDLKLEWTRDTRRFVDDKILLENLAPPSTLYRLEIQGYNGVSFPPWLMGQVQLPNLQKLDLRGMEHLEEWNMSYNSNEDKHVIRELDIHDCPKLTVKWCPPSVQWLFISNSDNALSSWGECVVTSRADASSSSASVTTYLAVNCCNVPLHQWRLLHHLPSLITLRIEGCGDLTGSPEITGCLNSLEKLHLQAKDHDELPEWLGELKSLYQLKIQYRGIEELHDNMRQLTKLQSLELNNCKSMTSLPHWLGELTSLEKLNIRACDVIRSFPDSIQQLANLYLLDVESCPELKRWCESEENKTKLAHIKHKVCILSCHAIYPHCNIDHI